MINTEFKKMANLLDINGIYVIINEKEYDEFKNIKLFCNQKDVFKKIEESFENEEYYMDTEEDELFFYLAFHLDTKNDFNIIEYYDLGIDGEEFIEKLSLDNNYKFNVQSSIILSLTKLKSLVDNEK